MNTFLKLTVLPIILYIMFNFLEYGGVWDGWNQFVYPAILTVISLMIILKSNFRKLFLILALSLIGFMVVFYLFNEMNFANLIGSLGLAILVIVFASYIPDLLRKGYIEHL